MLDNCVFRVTCDRIPRRNWYYVKHLPNNQLHDRIMELPKDKRKFNPSLLCWEISAESLASLIKRYKGSNKIKFDFGNETSRQIFIDLIKKLDEKENEKRRYVESLAIKKEEWIKFKKHLEENYEQYVDTVQQYLNPNVKLYPHQITSTMYLNAVRNALLALDMGTGKSLISIAFAEMNPFKKVFVITPNSLKFNYYNEVKKFTNSNAYIVGKKNDCSIDDAKYIIVNYEFFNSAPKSGKAINKMKKLGINKIDCLIVDECFTYDTLIDTNKGKLKIGDIVENKLDVKVLSYNHELNIIETKPISRYLFNGYKKVIRLNLSNGSQIECTPEHKFFSVYENKYKPIIEFKKGDILYEKKETENSNSNSCLFKLWNGIQTKTKWANVLFDKMFNRLYIKRECKKIVNNEGEKWKFITKNNINLSDMRKRISNTRKNEEKILFEELFSDLENEPRRYKRKGTFKRSWKEDFQFFKKGIQRKSRIWNKNFIENEGEKSNVQRGKYIKNERKIKKPYIFVKRWKWAINKTTISTFFGNIWKYVYGNGTRNSCDYPIKGNESKYTITTNSLQSGYWNTINKTSDRGGWKFTQNEEVGILGQEKDRNIGIVRVESIEILESGNRQGIGCCCSKNQKVFDLEIEDNHNYFANGILVSNCHRLKSSKSNTYINFKKIFKDDFFIDKKPCKIFMSGTPAPSRAAELYNVLNQISPTDFPTKTHFYNYYLGMEYNHDEWGWKPGSELSKFEELFNKIAPFTYRKKKSEVLKDLPEKTYQKVLLEMTDDEYNVYYDLEAGVANEFINKEIHNPLAIMGKLREYTAALKVNSVSELIDSILDTNEKFVGISFYKDCLIKLHEKYKGISVLHTGDFSDVENNRSVTQFQDENSDIKLFFGSESTTKEGLTLTAASKVGMLTIPWTPGTLDQCTDRCARIGQKNAVNAYVFIYKDTIDEYIFDLIESKRSEISQVIDGEKYDSNVNQSIINDLIKKIKDKHAKQ